MKYEDALPIEEWVRAARVHAAECVGWFAPALYAAPLHLSDALPAPAAIDRYGRVYFNPQWVARLYEACGHDRHALVRQLAQVWYHEVAHWLREHEARANALHADARLWNLAADMEINDYLPEGMAYPSLGGEPLAVLPRRYNLPDGEIAEWYYQRLVERAREQAQAGGQQQSQAGGQQQAQSNSSASGGGGATPSPPAGRVGVGVEVDTAPHLTSPVDGGGGATPSPHAGRVGVGVEADTAPYLTSPVDGGGSATPSPPAGRVGVGVEVGTAPHLTSPVDGGGSATPSPPAGRAGVEVDTAPHLTSPVDGGGSATPSPPAGRVGVGVEVDTAPHLTSPVDGGGGATPSPHAGTAEKGWDEGSGVHGQARPWELHADDPSTNALSDFDRQALQEEVARRIVEHQKERGTAPAGWLRWAEAILKPKVNWREQLKRILRGVISEGLGHRLDYSYRRPHRRSAVYHTIYLPALQGEYKPRVACVVDTSGSISDRELMQSLAEVRAVLEALRIPVTIIPCDAVPCEAIRVFHGSDWLKVRQGLRGGGGTDMVAGLNAALALKPKPEAVIVLTDGHTPFPSTRPKDTAVIWAIWQYGDGEPPKPPMPPWRARDVVIVPIERR
jgi:predicted metal-dependent peptidase